MRKPVVSPTAELDLTTPNAATASVLIPAQAGSDELPGTADELVAELATLELLPFTDPVGTLAPARLAELDGERLGRTDLALQARLVRGDALCRLGEMAEGGRISHEVNRWAAEHAHGHLLSRSHQLLAWFSHHIGDRSAHLEHALWALECAEELTPMRARCELMITLAVALSMNDSHGQARIRYQAAEDLAVALGDIPLQVSVLNNRSYGEVLAGEAQSAMDVAEQMLALSARHNQTLEVAELDTVARAQIELGRYAEAEKTLVDRPPPQASRRGTECNDDAELQLTLAEAQRLLGATDRAGATLDLCMATCEERGLAGTRVRVLQERAVLHALEGDFRAAYEQYRIFHTESEALLSAERDVRARTLQAVFETDEARKDSLRFRELSLHDPLTGLYNRRHVDEQLDILLRDAATTGTAVSVGIVDLDHFKMVNDTLSHGIGDDVLVRVAGLLTDVVTEPGFVARLGGEEFLLVLPAATAADALARCETARQVIRSRDWSALVGDLPITASIGVATAIAGKTTRSALLAEADRNLYSAKRAGRDRVVGHRVGLDDSGSPGRA